MDSWTSTAGLIELTALYAHAAANPQVVTDADFVQQVPAHSGERTAGVSSSSRLPSLPQRVRCDHTWRAS